MATRKEDVRTDGDHFIWDGQDHAGGYLAPKAMPIYGELPRWKYLLQRIPIALSSMFCWIGMQCLSMAHAPFFQPTIVEYVDLAAERRKAILKDKERRINGNP